jgi:thioredoxin reductase/Pyruvate/2-oxoacid:ferredoxin oxidoreductase delta subunit
MDIVATAFAAASGGGVAALAGLMAVRRALRSQAGARQLAVSTAEERNVPKSLHPVIDPDVCIGSLSCLKSCPEGDILGFVAGAAALVEADHCIGHGKCAAECPVDAIQLVFGTAKRGVDLPETNAFFESSQPGVYVIGELGGMGLIKNAMRQGLECAAHIAGTRGSAPAAGGRADVVDVVIVGAGPAGLAAALGAKQSGLSYRLIDQGVLGGTVAHYPRHKIVMTETIDLPLYGRFGKKRISKTELMESFQRIVTKAGLRVDEGVKLVGLEGRDGAFEVLTEAGGRIGARKVILAVGRRGTPRKLGVPGEELPKVTYSLTDAEQYRGKKVLVVGGGDSAIEAACDLVEQGGAQVVLSYRGPALARCRAANRARIERLVAEERLHMILSSEVRSVGPAEVILEVGGKRYRFANDYVIVNIGGELPTELLKKAGVGMRRYASESLGAPPRTSPLGMAPKAPLSVGEQAQRRFEHRLSWGFAALGAALLAFLAWKGRAYYPLSMDDRLRSPLHQAMRSAGPWGRGVGIVATAFMLSNFLYAARKRFRFMMRWGHIRSWLHFHVFVGFMSPLVVAFHAAFQSRNLLATGTAFSLLVVVITGVVGRYVYGLVPASGGRAIEMEELQARFVALRDEAQPLLAGARDPARVARLFGRVTAPVGHSFLLALLAYPLRRIASWADLSRVRALFTDRKTFADFRDAFLRLEQLRVQIGFYRSLKRFLGGWRLFHASLAVVVVFIIAGHIGLAIYLGYGVPR